jgi:hypothetical protein
MAAARTELAGQLSAEREIVEQQRQRAEAAEQQANRAAAHIQHISTELSTAREHLERWQAQGGEQRAELAALRADRSARRDRRRKSPRLTDLHTLYDSLVWPDLTRPEDPQTTLPGSEPSRQEWRSSPRSILSAPDLWGEGGDAATVDPAEYLDALTECCFRGLCARDI